jgi:hypothetical protein
MASIVAPNLDLIEATEVSHILSFRTKREEHPPENYELDLAVHKHFIAMRAYSI